MGNEKDTTVTKRMKMPQAGDEEFESELIWEVVQGPKRRKPIPNEIV
jgi:hypothetical protein